MHVLVTGGAGYVGSLLVNRLIERGDKVTVLDSLLHKSPSLLQHFLNPNFRFVEGDVRDAEKVKDALEGTDAVVHLAAIVGAPGCEAEPQLAKEVNHDAVVLLISLAGPDRALVYASTGSNYGAVDGICTEETPLNPLSTYGVTKTAGENAMLETGRAVCYRFATAFGLSPRMRLDLLINDFTYQAVKNRQLVVYENWARRTFIHVRDMTESFIFALDNFDLMKGEVFNVGSDEMNATKKEVSELINGKVGGFLWFADIGSDPDKRDYEVSYEKIRNYGFNTTISLEEGINELIEGYKMIHITNPFSNMA
jgi:nucleoside-diphosphate-sugar epimerase